MLIEKSNYIRGVLQHRTVKRMILGVSKILLIREVTYAAIKVDLNGEVNGVSRR
jgi:hypothetical protein